MNDMPFNHCAFLFFRQKGWSGGHFQTNEIGISDHLRGSNQHQLNEKNFLYKYKSILIKCLYLIEHDELDNILSLVSSSTLSDSRWSRANLPINERGISDLQIKYGLFSMVDLHPFYKIQVHKWCDYVLISTMISIKYLTQSAMIEEQIHPWKKRFQIVPHAWIQFKKEKKETRQVLEEKE